MIELTPALLLAGPTAAEARSALDPSMRCTPLAWDCRSKPPVPVLPVADDLLAVPTGLAAAGSDLAAALVEVLGLALRPAEKAGTRLLRPSCDARRRETCLSVVADLALLPGTKLGLAAAARALAAGLGVLLRCSATALA